jgi:anaphase-promoting complex subunit 1
MLRTAAREGLAAIAMAWSMVMAGTGDLVTLKALRQLQNRISADVHYGHHMASHMALGLLFLGGGRFTLSRQPKAVALLLCAAYPHWPSHPSDQRPHLQLLRHFWAMAVEPRCIVVREIASGQVCSLPLEVELVQPTTFDNNSSVTNITTTKWIIMTSPCLLPDLNRVKTIRLHSSVRTHFPVELSLQTCPYQFDPYSQTWTILVKPATNQYPYIQDTSTSITITDEVCRYYFIFIYIYHDLFKCCI